MSLAVAPGPTGVAATIVVALQQELHLVLAATRPAPIALAILVILVMQLRSARLSNIPPSIHQEWEWV